MARIYCPIGNPSECMATIYDYGDGLVEGSWYPYPEPKNRYPEEKAERGESENREENEQIMLEKHGNGTKYTAIAQHRDNASKTRLEQMGFEEGWGACLDQLVAMVKAW